MFGSWKKPQSFCAASCAGARPFLRIEDIEDIVQNILLSVHGVRATYDPQRPIMPWLLAIARRHGLGFGAHSIVIVRPFSVAVM
jgi:hypothetical protein